MCCIIYNIFRYNIYTHAYIYIHILTHICRCVCVHTYVDVCVCLYTCVCEKQDAHISIIGHIIYNLSYIYASVYVSLIFYCFTDFTLCSHIRIVSLEGIVQFQSHNESFPAIPN